MLLDNTAEGGSKYFEFCAGTHDKCYQCGSKSEYPLRKCSRCKVARYCSTDCQRIAWKAHKKTCSENPFVSGATPEMNDNIESITRFADAWRNSIQAWALFALDIANMHEEYLKEHCFIVDLIRRPSIKKKEKLYALRSAGYMSNSDYDRFILERVQDEQYRANVVDLHKHAWEKMPPGPTIRFVVWSDIVSFTGSQSVMAINGYLVHHEKRIVFAQLRDTSQGRVLSRVLKDGFGDALRADLQAGRVLGCMEYLDRKSDESLAAHAAVWDVD